MVLYAVLLLSLLSRADTPLSLSLSSQFVSLVSRLFIRLFFLRVPLSRFRQYYEELSWNKAPQHQMFILFCSVCHAVSLPHMRTLVVARLFMSLSLSHTSPSFRPPLLVGVARVCYQLGRLTRV